MSGTPASTSANGTGSRGDTLKLRHRTNPAHLGYTKTYLKVGGKVGGVAGYFLTRTK